MNEIIQLSVESIDLSTFGKQIEHIVFCEALNDSKSNLKRCVLNLGARQEMAPILFSCLELDNLKAKLKSCDLNLAAEWEMVVMLFSCLEMDNLGATLRSCFPPRLFLNWSEH